MGIEGQVLFQFEENAITGTEHFWSFKTDDERICFFHSTTPLLGFA